MEISGLEKSRLRDALLDAFPPARFEELVNERLGMRLWDVAPPAADQSKIVFELIKHLDARDALPSLVEAARAENPSNAKLRAVAASVGQAPSVPSSLERIIEQDETVNPVSWRERLGVLEAQVCCLEVPGGGGSGFLVGPDLILTNEHVVADVAGGKVAPERVVVRFDYRKLADDRTVNAGLAVGLAESWLVDSSPHSVVDVDPGATGLPGREELDYAVVRLERAVGDEPIGERATSDAPVRGWIAMPDSAPDLAPGSAALILQHPRGRPVGLAFNTIIEVNDNRTRVRYRVDTDGGSSGSPVFDHDWHLVALHHSGDPDFRRDAIYNEGIPIDMVLGLLEQRGHRAELG